MCNVVTWNMQGGTGGGESKWYTGLSELRRIHADTICMQECGMPPVTIVALDYPGGFGPPAGVDARYFLYGAGSSDKPPFHVYWVHWDLEGNRVNLAIASLIEPSGLLYLPNPVNQDNRPVIGMTFGRNGILTLHAQAAGNANDAVALVNAVAAVFAGTGQSWFLAGDFNREPHAMAGLAAGVNLCGHDDYPTHPSSGHNLDYAYSSFPPIAGQVLHQANWSDHFPVVYTLP